MNIFRLSPMSPEHAVEVSIEQTEYTGDKKPRKPTNKKTFIHSLNIP